MLKHSKSSIEVPSGPGLPRIPTEGLLMLEGRKIISLTPNPLNIQLQCQMGRSQLNLIPLLSISNQGMMMVQPQASLCQNSTLMILFKGPFSADNSVTFAMYAKENDLLHIDGWKRFRNLAKAGKEGQQVYIWIPHP